MRGGEAIALVLARHGVTQAFSLAGTAHTYLLQAMAERGMGIISTRHETNTVLAADGYARVSGKLGVALIKHDQGLPNAMTGICTANAACSPVLVLASFSPASSFESGAEHDGADLDMVRGVAKWYRAVPSVERLGEYLQTAIRQATTGRPGVAVLGIPQEFQQIEAPAAGLDLVHPKPSRPAADPAVLDQLAQLIIAAERPMIVAGAGAMLAECGPTLREFARRWRIPVFGNSMGRGLVPEDNETGFSWPFAQVAARRADLVIAVGVRLTQRLGYGLPPRFAKSAIFAQIDIDPSAIGRNRPVDLAIHADAAAALEGVLDRLDALGFTGRSDPRWVTEALQARRARIDELGREPRGEIHPYAICRHLNAMLPEDAVVVGDGADILNWLHGVYFVKSARSYMDHYPHGAMGVGIGLALGAAAALREEGKARGRAPRPLVLLTGDGAFGFFCGELHSFGHAGLDVKVIIGNDGAWGTEHHGQLKALGTSYNCLLGKSDYEQVGAAFGFAARKVAEVSELERAVVETLEEPGPAILNVLTDTNAGSTRKSDPRVQTVAFEDLASSLKTHYTPDVA
jgi:acetolactate synthase-1/2/3 large subunit